MFPKPPGYYRNLTLSRTQITRGNPPRVSSQQPTVLVVDEEPAVASTYRMLLEDQGYRVATCDSYDCGRKRLTQQAWDATLIEMDLGTSSQGLKLAQQAKKLQKPPLVILSTGYPTLEALREALQLRVDYLLVRPADAEEMTRFLQRELARRQALKNREASARSRPRTD